MSVAWNCTAKVIPFPLILECRVCEEEFQVGDGYDWTQDRLCPECAWVKKHLAHLEPVKKHSFWTGVKNGNYIHESLTLSEQSD